MLYSVVVKFSSDGRMHVQGKEIMISIRSTPERGRANSELVKLLALHFRVEPGRVKIVSGLKSRKKLVEIL